MDCIIETLPRSNIRILFEGAEAQLLFFFLNENITGTASRKSLALNFQHLNEKNMSS